MLRGRINFTLPAGPQPKHVRRILIVAAGLLQYRYYYLLRQVSKKDASDGRKEVRKEVSK